MRILKIFFVNVFLFVVIIAAYEAYSVKYIWHEGLKMDRGAIKFYFDSLFHTIPADKYYDMLYTFKPVEGTFCPAFRPDINMKSNKKPVLFMGCSFTYGDSLKEEETPSAQFSKLTGRSVYNRACRGWGLSQLLYQAKRNDFYEQFSQEPEFLIYIFIFDHINRIDKHTIVPLGKELQPKYKVKNNHLVRVNPKPWDFMFIIQYYQYHKNIWKNRVTNERLKLYFTESEKEIRKHWENTNLVIFAYGDVGNYKKALNELQKENSYTVVWSNELADINVNDDKYKIDGWHPTAEVWEIMLPKLIKKLGINS